MSKTIDERVVEMRFDNKQFENGVQTSLSSLDKLKNSLKLEDASKGFENLDKAARNVDMSGLNGAVETVRAKFSALEVIAVAALVNITNSAINAGKQMIASLTIDQVTAGFTKYEQKVGAVQTIMNATGKSIDEVSTSLEKLNWFTDETSYNFTDMVSNIGKFTSAGVDLDVSITAMQGIANAAALAGQGTNEASRAMYNFAQAIGVGSVKLIDWKSIENANMATVEFKQTIIDSAVALGTLVETTDGYKTVAKGTAVSITDFNSALSEGWFSSEVLIDSLEKYGEYADAVFEIATEKGISCAEAMELVNAETMRLGEKAFKAAQEAKTFTDAINATKDAVSTGWMTTFEIIFGNYVEAKELWTDLANTMWEVFASGAEDRNEMLETWKELGGRDSLIQSAKNAFEGFASILTPIQEAFRDIFPKTTAENLLAMTKGLEAFTEKIKIGDDTADKLKRTFAGLFAVLDLVKQGFGFLLDVVTSVFGLFGGPAANSILDVTANLGDMLVAFRDAVNESGFFSDAIGTLRDIFTTAADKIRDAISRIKEAFGGFKSIDTTGLTELGDKLETSVRPFERIGQIFSAVFEAIVKVLEWAAPIVSKLGSIASGALGKLADTVSNAVQNMDFNSILDLLNTGLFAAILVGVKKFISSLTEITSGASGFLDGITGILDGVRGSLEAYQSSLKAKTLLTIASAIGILAAALVVLSMIPSEKLTTALMGISVLFVELSASMIILGKAMGTSKMAKVSTTMIAMAAAILILSNAMKNLAELDWEGLAKGTIGIAALAATLVIAANSLDKSSGKLIKGATGLIAFAAAILIMSKAVEGLSGLSWEELAKGLTGLTVILAEVVAVTHLMGDSKRMISTGVGMIALGAAMLIFAEAVERMGQLSWEEIGKGLVTMAGALTAITLAMNLLPKGMVSKATGMVVMGAALLIIANAVKSFGDMQWDEIAKGLIAMAGALTAITLAMNFLPKGMITKATGMVVLASSLLILSNALKSMAEMTWEEIAKGLVTLAGSMTILAVALNTMQGTLSGAAAMLVVSAALRVFVPALQALGQMPVGEIVTGLLALAGAFAVIGVAAAILQPLTGTILALAGGIALLGAGIALVGIGVLAFSAGLTALSVSATAAAAAIVVIGTSVLSLIPIFFEKIGEGIIALGGVIINGAPVIKEAFLVLLQSALEAITESIPMVVTAVLELVVGILDALDANLPAVVDKLFNVVIQFLDQLAARLPELIQAGANLLGAFLKGIFDAMTGYQPDNLFNTLSCITLLIAAFIALAAAKKFAKDALIAAGIMAAVMAIITAIFVVISALDLGNVLEISLSLSTVLLAISAAMVILSLLPTGAAIGAVANLAIFVGGLAALLAALGALAQIPGLEWLMGEGSRMLVLIGDAIGGFVGSIIGGFLTGVSASFVQIGEDLSAFMAAVTPFIEGAKNIDSSAMAGVKALAETVLILTAAGILEGLTSWLTGGSSMVSFGQEIAAFAPYFLDYYNTIKDVDGSVVEASANAAKALAEFAQNIPNSGGLLAKITGENSITQFAEELKEFGPALMDYSRSVTGLNADVVENSANAALALAEMANNLPNQGGVVGWFTGENSLSIFAEELVQFGPKLKAYADSVTGLDSEVVVNSANAAMALAELANNLPNQGGAVSWFTGDNTLSVFGEELAAFGPYLASYGRSIAGLDASVVTNSANAAKALSELANNLPNSGGLVSLFTGDNNIADFGADVAEFGKKFGEYYGYIKDISMSQMSGVISGVNALVEMAKNVKDANIGGLQTFAADLTKLGDLGIEGFLSAFENANTKATAAVSTMITYVVTGISNGQPQVDSQMTILVTSMINVMVTKTPEMTQVTYSMVEAISTAITYKAPTATQAAVTMVTSMITAVERRRSDWTTAASYLVDGFVLGITNNQYKAINAAIEMAKKTLQAINATLGVASPAKELIKTGKYSAEGLAQGMTDNGAVVRNAAISLGTTLLTSLKNFLGINSPSTVARDEVGRYFVQGIAEGITEDMSAEEAATKKAQNIVNAFKTELDKFSLDATTVDLEYQLWEKLYSSTATDGEKAAAKMANLNDNIAIQTEKVALAQGEYQQTLEVFGANSDEAQEAYNKFLKEQISLAGMINDIKDLQSEYAASQKEASQRYYKYLMENQQMLLECGFGLEEIQAAARQSSGYDPDALQNAMSSNVTDATTAAMNTVQSTYASQSDKTFGSLLTSYSDWGSSYAEAMGQGITYSSPMFVDCLTTMINSGVDAVERRRSDFVTAGGYLIEGLILGIQQNESKLTAAAEQAALAAYRAALAALGIASPSTKGIEIGRYFDLGIAVGLEKYAYLAENEATNVGNTAVDGLRDALSGLSRVVDDDLDMSPTIRPVIDLTDVENGTKQISALFSRQQALNISSTRADAELSRSQSGDDPASQDVQGGTTYNFNQTNNSPKALSRLEIYRQSKNLFSTLKGVKT